MSKTRPPCRWWMCAVPEVKRAGATRALGKKVSFAIPCSGEESSSNSQADQAPACVITGSRLGSKTAGGSGSALSKSFLKCPTKLDAKFKRSNTTSMIRKEPTEGPVDILTVFFRKCFYLIQAGICSHLEFQHRGPSHFLSFYLHRTAHIEILREPGTK